MAEKKHDLYIGIKSDLSALNVDLNALTRGLVVVGQSGCGKSFLIGRLIEEIQRKTTDKTQVLIVDSNSDFVYGTKLKSAKEMKRCLNKYRSGLLTDEFQGFLSRELKRYKFLLSKDEFEKSQIFGRTEPFNLSWEWLVGDERRFLKIVKGNKYAAGYPFAFGTLQNLMKEEHELILKSWCVAITEALALKMIPEMQDTSKFEYINTTNKRLLELTPIDPYLEILRDLGYEEDSKIWREKPDDHGLPERMFKDSDINILQVENIQDMVNRIKVVLFVLLHCWNQHVKIIEKCRKTWDDNDKEAYERATSNLKHTFILIDEVHNYAREGHVSAHVKILGDLIHTIAAEGRKYGLHLILATQRPNKVKSGLLGECDNAIIMKMNSRKDLEHLADEMRILDVKLLEPCLHFQGQGNAMAVGEMTRMAPYVQLFKSAPRRTVEGGVDIEGF